jgi:tRNA dimethylallyltransferase
MNSDRVFTANCWCLTGPTAGGKTAVALELAALLDAEILSLDSMAVYRGMDIGTAKPTLEQRHAVPHHLVDLVEPDQDFSLARYVGVAEQTVRDIVERGRTPLFVGGTPLYLKGILRGIFTGPPADWPLRRRLQSLADETGAESLHARLAEVDPHTARRLHPRDVRRVIRALEVWEKTGQSITTLQQQFERARPPEACRVFVLDWPRPMLIERINARVDAMFEAGLVREVHDLLNHRPTLGHTASQALGYREVIEHLQGVRSLDETTDLVKRRTRQFAKRQMTWFRSLSECRFVAMAGRDASEVASHLAREPQQF